MDQILPHNLLQIIGLPRWPGRLRLGAEDRLCIDFAADLRQLTLEGKLMAIWLHVPNEGKRSLLDGFLCRALGRLPGAPDYLFISGHSPAAALEFKALKGRQTDTQKIFEQWCHTQGVRYAIVRSKAEAFERLKEWNILAA